MKRLAKIACLAGLTVAGLGGAFALAGDIVESVGVDPRLYVEESQKGDLHEARFRAEGEGQREDLSLVLLTHMSRVCGSRGARLENFVSEIREEKNRAKFLHGTATFRCRDKKAKREGTRKFQERLCGQYRDSPLLKETCDDFLDWN